MFGRIGAAALRRLDPETAHGVAVRALAGGLVPGESVPADPRLAVPFFDMTLPNPIGMAAGFDKNAEVPDALLRLGFGFVEVGTITPRAQAGNPRPRLFRLPEDGAVINRLGFNNDGHGPTLGRLAARMNRRGVLGINVGANKDSADRAADYVTGIAAFAPFASYFTVNVSSPNTPGLRDLQARDALDDLLARVIEARDRLAGTGRRKVPVLLKIAPDLTEAGLDDVAEVSVSRGIDGLVVSNTTLSREGLRHPLKSEAGGLSGRPLFARSTIVLAKMRQRIGPERPILGVGGVSSAAEAAEKMAAGATAVQLYTAFIYGGSGLPAAMARDLLGLVKARKLASVTALTGTTTAAWAARPIPA
ncbi:quinone-dependent dihydroorotate dehydrogenase [Chthonobacter rhizosphaerae]|uniref:quinone-dependent dihydroorotate dehydrogenase n=1 Tax=Chthonobacter rhizosphaerae TaxID=2735553 RepID=UPI001FE31464|nr:quinone-dependent dihydroorotate dehydrogenase [Chthonobacter rhizosphaerae]